MNKIVIRKLRLTLRRAAATPGAKNHVGTC